MDLIPKYWIDFLEANHLHGIHIEIPDDNDLSEIGATFKLMNEQNCMEEMQSFYPGILVKHKGYIPIGSCSNGSGDPYFINSNDGPNGKLYRIYHDEVIDQNYNSDSAITIVLTKYEDILKFKV
ncbi:hypothetical protein [Roseivirga seohaensis]|uniref:hypothetical protein n=1 Tax=Roseivirga seohaensis TaxID=1914963 RepID=UPI003BAD45A6